MKEILKTALDNKMIISICVNKINWDKRIIGYVRSVTREFTLLDTVDIFGAVVERKKIKISSITIIELNDSYNRHLQKLKEEGKLIKKAKPQYYYNKGDKFYEKIELLRLSGSICTIFFDTEFTTGIIIGCRENILTIHGVGYRGTKEGKLYCAINCVTKIRYEGPVEKKIFFLQKYNL